MLPTNELAMRGHGEHASSQMKKGFMRLFILKNLSMEPLHGYGIMKRISEKSRGFWSPKAGFVYPLLRDMVEEGLITPISIESRRKIYAITEKGKAELLQLFREAEDAVIHITEVFGRNGNESIQMYLQLLEQLSAEERAERIRSRLEALEALIDVLSKIREEFEQSGSVRSTERDD